MGLSYSGKNTGGGCHFLLQGNFPDLGIGPASSVSPELAGRFFSIEPSATYINNNVKLNGQNISVKWKSVRLNNKVRPYYLTMDKD